MIFTFVMEQAQHIAYIKAELSVLIEELMNAIFFEIQFEITKSQCYNLAYSGGDNYEDFIRYGSSKSTSRRVT